MLAFLGVLVFFVAAHEHELQHRFYRVLADIQGGVGGGPVQSGHTGVIHDLDELFTLKSTTLHVLGVVLFVYAAVEGAEAVGLWYQRRWAEYLTFIATALFLPLEVYELTRTVSPFKVTALVINLAILVLWSRRSGCSESRAGQRRSGLPASATSAGRLLERTARAPGRSSHAEGRSP